MSQATDHRLKEIKAEATLGGLVTEFYILDEAQNRYYYDITEVVGTRIERVDGHSVVWFGFKTLDKVPQQAEPMMADEQPVIEEEWNEENPF